MAKEGRTEAGLKVEEAFLTKLRAEAKITAWSDVERKKAKRSKSEQKAAPPKPCKSIEEAKKGLMVFLDRMFGNPAWCCGRFFRHFELFLPLI